MKVEFTRASEKQLKKAPKHVVTKLSMWVDSVLQLGLEATRKVPGYHDEPLQGAKKGRRSIRLNRQWRAEYTVMMDDEGRIVVIMEVHAHDY